MSKNAIQSYLEQEEDKNKVQKAVSRFDFKPFRKKFAGLKILSKVCIFFLPSISVITGTIFLGNILAYVLPFHWLAFVFGLILVFLLEYLKSYLLNIGLTDYFAKIKSSFILISLGVLFCVLSAFLSLQGIREIHKGLDTSLQDLSAVQTNQKDSISKYFDKEIQQAKAELKDFKNAISWNGKIDTRNKDNNKTLQDFSSQIQNLQQSKQTALQQLYKSQNTQYEVLERANGMNLTTILLIVLSIEVLILLSNWFVIFYDFKTKVQKDKLEFGQNVSLHTSDIEQMAKHFFMSNLQLGLNQNPIFTNQSLGINPNPQTPQNTDIGFNYKEVKPMNSLNQESEETAKITQYLAKYKEVVKDFENPKVKLSQKQMTKVKYKVYEGKRIEEKYLSLSTIKNIKRTLDNVKQSQN